LWNFTLGFINSTNATNYTEIDICRDEIINDWIGNANSIANASNNSDVLSVVYSFLSMTYNVDTIAHTCYSSFESAGWTYYNWMNHTYAGQLALMNTLFYFGDLFDDLRGFILYFLDTPF